VTENRINFRPGDLAVALVNFEWLIRNREASFHPDSLTVVYGDGGMDVKGLFEEGLTPATRGNWRDSEDET
jgi:hypothetical protein